MASGLRNFPTARRARPGQIKNPFSCFLLDRIVQIGMRCGAGCGWGCLVMTSDISWNTSFFIRASWSWEDPICKDRLLFNKHVLRRDSVKCWIQKAVFFEVQLTRESLAKSHVSSILLPRGMDIRSGCFLCFFSQPRVLWTKKHLC